MRITLEKNQKERLRNAGLVNVTTQRQAKRGITSYRDPVTGAEYSFSPMGYATRRSEAGRYQLNPRVVIPAAFNGRRMTKATVRTNDSGALTELILKGVRNFRN